MNPVNRLPLTPLEKHPKKEKSEKEEHEGLLPSAEDGAERVMEVREGADDDTDDEEEADLEYHAETVITIMKPVSITMLFVVWAVKTIDLASQTGGSSLTGLVAGTEQPDDSTGMKLGKALLNAAIVLGAILVTTIIFVILYKYRCLKIIYGWLITSSLIMLGAFGGGFTYMLLSAVNWPMDAITFSFFLWNFAVVGILAIFWHGPTKVNQGYLIIISGLLAIFFTRLPEWTTFAILAVVAVYDIVAVLAPCGPLRMLVETAQQRQEPIPALLYNASVYTLMADPQEKQQQEDQPSKRKGVKLGLGDFIFYSVLIGRAALYDMITVFTCFIGIVTGLFMTLLLLAIFRKALPALPLSIFIAIIFYLTTRIFLLPYVITLGADQIFV